MSELELKVDLTLFVPVSLKSEEVFLELKQFIESRGWQCAGTVVVTEQGMKAQRLAPGDC
jgi:hypothetical protein